MHGLVPEGAELQSATTAHPSTRVGDPSKSVDHESDHRESPIPEFSKFRSEINSLETL